MPFPSFRPFLKLFTFSALFAFLPGAAPAQENPYFVSYAHFLEEPGNLEIEYFSTFGTQRGGNNFHAYWMEFEYGANLVDHRILPGWPDYVRGFHFIHSLRWENRFRVLKREHFINPVLYVEYEHKSSADKILKRVKATTSNQTSSSHAEAGKESINEIELKLILSSNFKGWNFTENTLAAKDLSNSPWEFGYAIGASRPLALKASPKRCSFCGQNFVAGAELYGGLGDRHSFGLHDTSHYFAPVVAWNLPSDWTLRLSAGFGLNDNSHRFLLRWGVSREIAGFGPSSAALFEAADEEISARYRCHRCSRLRVTGSPARGHGYYAQTRQGCSSFTPNWPKRRQKPVQSATHSKKIPTQLLPEGFF